jgi:hypothetical protein
MIKKDEYITIENEEYFEKIETEHGIVYRAKNYKGPIAIDATIRKQNDKSNEF